MPAPGNTGIGGAEANHELNRLTVALLQSKYDRNPEQRSTLVPCPQSVFIYFSVVRFILATKINRSGHENILK